VEATTWIPVKVATQGAVRYRRYRVQSSTRASSPEIVRQQGDGDTPNEDNLSTIDAVVVEVNRLSCARQFPRE
jgi:hypothetical protein